MQVCGDAELPGPGVQGLAELDVVHPPLQVAATEIPESRKSMIFRASSPSLDPLRKPPP